MDSMDKLIKSFAENKNGHAYLFETNDVEYAYNLIYNNIKKIMCPNIYNENCGIECNLCWQIDNHVLPSILTIEAKELKILKEDIINMKKYFFKNSLFTNYNIYIIKEAEKLNDTSANKLLKFLEEPDSNVIGFLITTNKKNVLPTIASRCQQIKLFQSENVSEYAEEVVELGNKFIELLENNYYYLIIPNENKITKRIVNRVMLIDLLKYILKKYYEKYCDIINKNKNINIKKIINLLKIIVEYLELSNNNVNIELFFDNFVIMMGRCNNANI